MPIEIESPEELGYDTIRYNLAESSFRDGTLGGFDPVGELDLRSLVLCYGDHLGNPLLRAHITDGAKELRPEHVTDAVLAKTRKLNDLALSRGQTLAQMALAWVLRHKVVTSALIGASIAVGR